MIGKKGFVQSVRCVHCVLFERTPSPSFRLDLISFIVFNTQGVRRFFFFLLSPQTYVPTDDHFIYVEDYKSHSEPKGVPERSDPNPNVKSPFSVMVFKRFLVALWLVVAASRLKNVSREIWKQCPGAKVCFLVMLRSSVSYNKLKW